jgi:hypothetical protein
MHQSLLVTTKLNSQALLLKLNNPSKLTSDDQAQFSGFTFQAEDAIGAMVHGGSEFALQLLPILQTELIFSWPYCYNCWPPLGLLGG